MLSSNQEVGSVGVGAGLYMYNVVVKSSRSPSSPDEFLVIFEEKARLLTIFVFISNVSNNSDPVRK